MKNSARFFSNKECEYFPCHKLPENTDDFNCLFCYCPLYALGDECGGIFDYETNLKFCQDCHLPHTPEFYDYVMSKFTTENLIKIGRPQSR